MKHLDKLRDENARRYTLKYNPNDMIDETSLEIAYTEAWNDCQAEMMKVIGLVIKHLEERIIDPCGYDPEKETKEDLVILVKSLSKENEILLAKLRELEGEG